MYPFKILLAGPGFFFFFLNVCQVLQDLFLVLCASFIYFCVAGDEMQGLASEAWVGLTSAAQMLSLMQLFAPFFDYNYIWGFSRVCINKPCDRMSREFFKGKSFTLLFWKIKCEITFIWHVRTFF